MTPVTGVPFAAGGPDAVRPQEVTRLRSVRREGMSPSGRSYGGARIPRSDAVSPGSVAGILIAVSR